MVENSQPISNVVSLLADQNTSAEGLLALASENSPESRIELFENVRDLFVEEGESLSERERVQIGEILRHLLHEVEMPLRIQLAEQLAHRADVPHALLVHLANEEFEIAHPILIESGILDDLDLIEVVRQRSKEHQLAVAMRKNLNEPVSTVLVETGDDDVIRTLLKNHGAKIAPEIMAYLVAQSDRVSFFQEPLLRRPDLPTEFAERMYAWVSAALKSHIRANFDVNPNIVSRSLDAAAMADLDAHARESMTDSPADAVVERAGVLGEDEVSLLLVALRDGEVPIFEAAFCKLSGLSAQGLRTIAYAANGKSMALLSKAVGLGKETFLEIFDLTRHAVDKSEKYDPAQRQTLAELFDRTNKDDAVRILTRWRRAEGLVGKNRDAAA